MKSLTVVSVLALLTELATAQRFDSMQCGATAGNQRCPGTLCCSQYGWCGSTQAYCATLTCQSNFGACNGVATAPVSTKGRCGSDFGGQMCKGSQYGTCCSVYGWCGATNDHCAAKNGCQSGFGTCSGPSSSSFRSSSTSSLQRSSSSPRPSVGSSTRASSFTTLQRSSSTTVQGARTSSGSSSMITQRSSGASFSNPGPSSPSSSPRQLSTPSASIRTSLSTNRESSASSQGGSQTPAATLSSTSLVGSSSAASSDQSTPAALSSSSSPTARPSTTISSLPPIDTQAFNRDPMENPSSFALERTSNLISNNQVTDSAGAHNGNSFVRIQSSDTNGASLTLSTQATVVSGTQYSVTLWVKSTVAGGACTVAVRVGTEIVAQSGSNLPTTWTSISGFYTAKPGSTSPTLAIDVVCPAIRAGRIRRRQTGAGVDLDDLTMVTASSVSSSLSRVVSTSTFVYGDDVTVLPSKTSASSFVYGDDVTVLPPSSIPAIPAIPSSTPAVKSSPASMTSGSPSISSSKIPSSTSSADACTPTLIDGGFELMDLTKTSPEWSTINDFGANTGSHFFGNVVPGTGQDSQNSYGMYTNDAEAVKYNIVYQHPLRLCRGTTYHVSAFVKTDQQDAAWTEGCRVSAFIDNDFAWSDRIGYFDWAYRYLDGTITAMDDTSTATLYFQINCDAPQIPNRRRGVKIDNVSIVPHPQWTLPEAAAPATTTTATRVDATSTQLPQYRDECVPVYVETNANGCAINGNQIPDAGFELCSEKTWTFNRGQGSSQWDWQTTGVFKDTDARSGKNRFQVMFNQQFGGVFALAPPNIPACAERTYIYSFWAKQATKDLCKTQVYWGDKLFGTHIPPAPQTNGGWAQFNGTIYITGKSDMFYGNDLYFSIQCDEGGPKSLSWYDDFHFQRIG